jgi:ribose transport system ATP-binding protein
MSATQIDTTPLLEIRGASKSFPGVRALDDVSIDLRRGEVLALVGGRTAPASRRS